MKIQPIVEGHGEVQAVPTLLRRILHRASIFNVDVGRPIRRPQSRLLQKQTLEQTVRLATIQPDCSAVLILFESEDDCPRELGPKLTEWAAAAAGPIPCAVVLAHREYEAWFLASLESLRGHRGIDINAYYENDPEAVRGAKEALQTFMGHPYSYSPTVDQAALSAQIDLNVAYWRSRSFRHLVKATRDVLRALRMSPDAWRWTEG